MQRLTVLVCILFNTYYFLMLQKCPSSFYLTLIKIVKISAVVIYVGIIIVLFLCLDIMKQDVAGKVIISNTLRTRQNAGHFPDDIFKCIFLNENVILSTEISLNFVHKGPINNIPALVQITAWRRNLG